MGDLQAQVNQWEQLDATRTALQKELVRKAEDLSEKLKKSQDRTKSLQDDVEKANGTIREHQLSIAMDKFVLVLIDGDSVPFQDSFVSRGTDGGIDAGRQLRAAIQDYHRTLPSYHPDERIVIYVFANLKKLSKASQQAKIIADEMVLAQFTSGFNASHYLTTFVDAGSQKEAADSKMKAYMELLYRNCHCQHIVFGSCDNGYAGFLATFALASGINQRVTTLHSPLIPHHLRKTLELFRLTGIANLFRNTKISPATHSVDSVAGIKRRAPELPSDRQRRPPPIGYSASQHSTVNKVTTTNAMRPSEPCIPPTLEYPTPPYYYVNESGQRVDPPLVIDRKFMSQLNERKRRLCNNHYIRGHCNFGTLCSHDHSLQLNRLQVDSLRHIARGLPCRDAFCKDVGCPLGHVCTNKSFPHNLKTCRYPAEAHYVDVGVVYGVDPENESLQLIDTRRW